MGNIAARSCGQPQSHFECEEERGNLSLDVLCIKFLGGKLRTNNCGQRNDLARLHDQFSVEEQLLSLNQWMWAGMDTRKI